MKRVLITNLFFAKYTGSELHVLEMAKLFEKRGFEVTIAVFEKAYPLLEKAGTIHVVDVLNEELEDVDYDIVFVQHYPVLDFLCCKYNISYKKLIISKLSVINDLEHLPICTSDADLILCVSDECAAEVYKLIGKNQKVRVFKNSVSAEFFNSYVENGDNRNLKKIAIISNHVPEELRAFSQIGSKTYEIDYIGMQYTPRFVNVELLKKYDLVITIGRTVQQCFALGIPVYVYDYFGGPGYINNDNFSLAERNNFSGRGGFGKKTALELKLDIESHYEENLSYLNELNSIAKKEYSYDMNFEQIYQELLPEEDWVSKKMDYYKGPEKQRMTLYSKAASIYALENSITSQLYIDDGNGFDESNSIKWNTCEGYLITRKIAINKRVRRLRFDPCDVPAECVISYIYINGKLKEEYVGRRESFFNFDPQFMIELSEEEQNLDELNVEIIYWLKTFKWQDTLSEYNTKNADLQYQLNVSKEQIKGLEQTVEAIKEYYKLTPKNIMRRMIKFFKR